MRITFGDGAFEAFMEAVRNIPSGYTVALLGEDDDRPIDDGIYSGRDVSIVATTPEGVAYREINSSADPVGPIIIKPWEEIDRVHVY